MASTCSIQSAWITSAHLYDVKRRHDKLLHSIPVNTLLATLFKNKHDMKLQKLEK